MRKAKRLTAHKLAAKQQRDKPDPWEHITFRGWEMSRYTAAALKVLEEILGFELTLLQGPFNPGGVAGSAGTHDLDGVVDLAPFRARRKCTIARCHSWASWVRPVNWDGQGGSKHVHQVLKRAKPMADLAIKQLEVDYPNHDNGLASHAPDNFPVHPAIDRFDFNEWWHDELLESKIRGVNARIQGLLEKLSAARARKKRLIRQQQH